MSFRIDMYVEGTTDLMLMVMTLPMQPAENKEKQSALIIERTTTRYFPVYEKVSNNEAGALELVFPMYFPPVGLN